MQLTPSVLSLAACGLSAFTLVAADAHCDTRYGTKHWIGPFWDPDSCGKGNYGKCYPKKEDTMKLLWDQFDKAFEDLCKDVSCEGSFDIKFPGSGCDSKKLGPNKAYSLKIEAEYTHGDRDGVKEAYTNTIQKLNKQSTDCGFFDTPGVNQIKVEIPTDINIVRDTGDHGLRSTMHIMLDTGGESACGLVNDMWGTVGGSIPGGALFGAILKGTCK
ncbi:uncharacterized protein LMH87_008071 [Akanthomyces muscarius]|uniref:Uncharacterized protein n=1 Tax=Akanthomyces muscarius TaxID=2231603 RepID=A0A9W8QI01_AKAMU|nr:uncharacterized protein LMH87_008071 [Akanthomyces muscarius]KAJ4159159.1 hypothetical protein LMH87_008071 [Akanthomyces muscarius]